MKVPAGSPTSRLRTACEKSDLRGAKKALLDGADPSLLDLCQGRSSALHIACKNDDVALMKLLLENGANVNGTDRTGRTPLHYATTAYAAQLLLSKGALPNVHAYDGCTQLHSAAFDGNLDVIRELLKNGADINADSSHSSITFGADFDMRPIHIAASEGHLNAVKFLLDKGAAIDAKNSWFATPLYLACLKDRFEVAQFLIEKGADAKTTDADGSTPLHMASRLGNVELAKLLLKTRANVNAKDDHGETPLDYACKKGKADFAKFLRSQGGREGEYAIAYHMVWYRFFGLRNIFKAPKKTSQLPRYAIWFIIALPVLAASAVALPILYVISKVVDNSYGRLASKHAGSKWGC